METLESVKLTPQTDFSFPVALGTILTSLCYQLVQTTRQDENVTGFERVQKFKDEQSCAHTYLKSLNCGA